RPPTTPPATAPRPEPSPCCLIASTLVTTPQFEHRGAGAGAGGTGALACVCGAGVAAGCAGACAVVRLAAAFCAISPLAVADLAGMCGSWTFGVAVSRGASLFFENELGITPVITAMPTRLNRVTEIAASAISGLIFFESCMLVLHSSSEGDDILILWGR